MPIVRPKRRGPGRPSANETPLDRIALLECAEQLIRREGPGVSLEAIAAEAGVTKPIVYHHVGGKEAVVQELAFRLNERHAEASRAAVVGLNDPAKAIKAFVDAYLEGLEADRNLYLYVTGGATGGPEGVLRFADQSARQFADRLADLRGARTKKQRAAALPWAYGVIGMLHFVALWWLRAADRTRSELAEQLTDLLWKGLRGDRDDAKPTKPARPRGH